MNKIKKILLRFKKYKLRNDLYEDLHSLLEYLSMHSTPTYQEINNFYIYWNKFNEKYIQTPENSLLYDILEVLNKKECRLVLSYTVLILNKWLEVVINYDKQLTTIVDTLSTTKGQITAKTKTREYALNTIKLQQALTNNFQKLIEIFEKYVAIKE